MGVTQSAEANEAVSELNSVINQNYTNILQDSGVSCGSVVNVEVNIGTCDDGYQTFTEGCKFNSGTELKSNCKISASNSANILNKISNNLQSNIQQVINNNINNQQSFIGLFSSIWQNSYSNTYGNLATYITNFINTNDQSFCQAQIDNEINGGITFCGVCKDSTFTDKIDANVVGLANCTSSAIIKSISTDKILSEVAQKTSDKLGDKPELYSIIEIIVIAIVAIVLLLLIFRLLAKPKQPKQPKRVRYIT